MGSLDFFVLLRRMQGFAGGWRRKHDFGFAEKINAVMWRIALEKNLPLCYTILGYFHNIKEIFIK
jgi:hypothetical protein